ncbi:MAG: LysR family transcriptional regulator [Pseudomonadota bacterium]
MRAFEAALRLGGFAAAAEELSVTPGAVAAHVKALEALIGAPLFHRRAQGVEPTALAKSAAREFNAAFDQLGGAMQRLRRAAAPKSVRIAALPAIAQLWLSPRLPDLREAWPDAAFSIVALERPPDLTREAFDLTVFFTAANGAALTIDGPRVEAAPVCAPSMAERIADMPDLLSQTRLTDAEWREDWARWSPEAAAPDGPVHSLYALAVEEAANGGGALIGRRPLIDRHLEDGRLVAPLDRWVDFGETLVASLALDDDHLKAVAARLLGQRGGRSASISANPAAS